MKHSKAYRAATENIDESQLYSPEAALAIVKKNASAKFDETVEVALRLGVDPRKADQMVRGTVNLPNGTGKTARVLVFATGERAAEATAAGADEVGAAGVGQAADLGAGGGVEHGHGLAAFGVAPLAVDVELGVGVGGGGHDGAPEWVNGRTRARGQSYT